MIKEKLGKIRSLASEIPCIGCFGCGYVWTELEEEVFVQNKCETCHGSGRHPDAHMILVLVDQAITSLL